MRAMCLKEMPVANYSRIPSPCFGAALGHEFLSRRTGSAECAPSSMPLSSWSSSTSASLESGKAIPSRPTIILDFRHPDFQSKALPFD